MSMTKRPIRAIRVEGDVAYLTLTRGYEAMIDVADIGLVNDANWNVFTPNGRNNIYADRRTPTRALLHRVIMGFPAMQVDHINGNGLDNRRCNLRLVTHSENQMNRKGPAKQGTSGARGVSFNKAAGKWIAYIHAGGKHIYLGRFADKDSAIAARVEAAAKFHGDFRGR
jgi:hypothetical protein